MAEEKLTEKEREILWELARRNLNSSEVARQRFMHRNTVVYHMEKIKKKTGKDPATFWGLAYLLGMQPAEEGINHDQR